MGNARKDSLSSVKNLFHEIKGAMQPLDEKDQKRLDEFAKISQSDVGKEALDLID